MNFKDRIEQVLQSLLALDPRKKMILGGAVVITLAAVILASVYVGKPVTSPLYTNLSKEDLVKLCENSISASFK